jgi:hypothetical protein
MFRARIGLAAAVVVAVLTVAVTFSVGARLNARAAETAMSLTERAQLTFPSLDLLRGIELTNDTARMAREDEFADVLGKTGVDDMRQAAFVAVSARNARLESQGRKADLVAVVGGNGHLVSRDLNINAMYDEDLKARYPSVAKALEGYANKDIWSFDGKMYRVAAAPIRSRAGQIAGALVVGYVASANDAMSDHDRLGAEVAYVFDTGEGGNVQASSFKKQGGESTEEKELASELFGADKPAALALSGEMTRPFRIRIGGEEYLAAAGPLSGNLSKSRSGFVVLSSLGVARTGNSTVQAWVLLLGLISLLAAVAAAVFTALRFIQPLDTVEAGVSEVINGNRDYTFESPSEDFEGLANGLNAMIAHLLGRPEPDSDEAVAREDERWQGEINVDEPTQPGSGAAQPLSPENAALAAEPEADYLQRVYGEWMAARKQTGEGTDAMTLEGFVAKLAQNEAAMKKKYGANAVRFKVVVKNNQATLKPVPIR